MRLKDYPEIILDDIPKLYEKHHKVFITHLYGIEEKVNRLPKKFCRMYTIPPIAKQLLCYLRTRSASISEQDFYIVPKDKPFTLRLSDGKRLELMLCAGNELGNSLMLLVRKLNKGRLLYYYSAVQQDDLCRLMGNTVYQEWIAQGTEVLYLNLQAVDKPFKHIDYEDIAQTIIEYGKDGKDSDQLSSPTVLEIPFLGYEYVIRRLSQTSTLYGHMKMMGNYLNCYRSLSPDLSNFEQPGYMVTVHVKTNSNASFDNVFPLENLHWSPIPNRINLIQLCSLLRPLHINGIVSFHANSNVPPAPQFLKRFKFNYSPRSVGADMETQVAETQMLELSNSVRVEHDSPAKTQQQEGRAPRKDTIVLSKQRKLAFVDYDDDDDDSL